MYQALVATCIKGVRAHRGYRRFGCHTGVANAMCARHLFNVKAPHHRFWQADMIWAGGIKNLVSTAKEMDIILQQQLPQMPGHPEFNFDTWNYPPADEDSEF